MNGEEIELGSAYTCTCVSRPSPRRVVDLAVQSEDPFNGSLAFIPIRLSLPVPREIST